MELISFMLPKYICDSFTSTYLYASQKYCSRYITANISVSTEHPTQTWRTERKRGLLGAGVGERRLGEETVGKRRLGIRDSHCRGLKCLFENLSEKV